MDGSRCRAALEYLVENAVKFNKPNGRVDIDLSERAGAVQVRIRDTGIGIPAEELEKVFAPFYQVDRRLNRAYEGAGVGLTLAKRYIELHNGALQLTSKSGDGTVVDISLPTPSTAVTPPKLESPTL